MKQPKFKIGDKVTLIYRPGVFEISAIHIDKHSVRYSFVDDGFICDEIHMNIAVEPKQKVKMWLYAYQHEGEWRNTELFLKDDNHFRKNHYSTIEKFKKLEWSMIEVDCD